MSKVALITGASRGIGKAIALALAERGYDLVLLARDADALAAVAGACAAQGVRAHCLPGDVTDCSYLDQAVQAALARFGTVDVLINNAGLARQEPVQNADLAAWRAVMAVNFDAVVHLCQALLPAMIERGAGTIVNISSISGRNAGPGAGIYSASKHALNGFGGSLFEDVRDYGIKVSTIMPGFVATDLTGGMGMDATKMIAPEDVAQSVCYVLQAAGSCCPTEIVLRPQLRPGT